MNDDKVIFTINRDHCGEKMYLLATIPSVQSFLDEAVAVRMIDIIVVEFVRRYIDEKFAEMASKIDIKEVIKSSITEISVKILKNLMGEK